MPGVGFEPTSHNLRPDLKSGALTTRPTWRCKLFAQQNLHLMSGTWIIKVQLRGIPFIFAVWCKTSRTAR